MRIILTFTLLMIPGVVSSISVTGYSGGGVTITCKYKTKYEQNEKSFCRGDQSSTCSETKDDSGRFSLYDDTSSAVLKVTIRNLSEEDSGTYYCTFGKTRGKDSYTEVNLKVIRDQQNRTVRGYSGGNVIINFKYKMKHKNNVEVCKTAADQCLTVMNTNRAAEQKHDGRFSVYNNRSADLLRVFIRELNVNDSGEYKITVKVSKQYSVFSEFNLDIRDDDCCEKSISLSAAAGGSVNISCKYPQSHRKDVKFLCWRSGDDLCAEESSVTKKSKWINKGKIKLYDDREKQLLTGSISHVTEQHSEYWCGVQSDQGHKSFITRVQISVTVKTSPSTVVSSTSTSLESPNTSAETSSPPPSSSTSSSSSVKTSPSTVVSSTSTSLASPNTSAGSSLIIPLVLFFLVLIIAGLLLLFFCKKCQSQGGDSSSQTGPRKHEVVSHTGCDYEEIKDAHKQLPTNPSDSSDTVYSTAKLPTNPSDSNCVYVTVQKATGDSQCCITSAEDLNYAVVNFHKKSDCPDSVSSRNNQDYSEYAAVNHFTA
ncbi:polymeric immunoglobulin receptor isoform X2 [Megalobrama amblycephala]|uniref:polymeric immunoglobulin receptor isoform X2 n=1 Tax=Megalobrama amblycephala TaxID=75352 RepID=UPI0020141686|nr:polymeric immunoglobulin receptor isoform X2 [Megalobrama amblycephala]